MEWAEFWESLLDERKLRQKVKELNEVDKVKNHAIRIEEICHYIYDDYEIWKEDCEKTKHDIWTLIEKLPGIHLHTSRIKTVESLIEKVITKRHEWLADDESKYANISVDNYRDIITDLVGLRLIISYRGHWLDMHNAILSVFPLDDSRQYMDEQLLPHKPGYNTQAELPKVYYAEGDDITQYKDNGLRPKKHKMNYRSIHYTVSFGGVYIEIQVRTIYDEAWSDFDHSYVYKQDNNKSHSALEQMSQILSKLTNLSSDIGEQMREIYDSESVIEKGDTGWTTPKEITTKLDKIIQRMVMIEEDLRSFRSKMTIDAIQGKGGGENDQYE